MEHPEISSTSHWVKEPHPLQEEAHLNTSNVSTSLLPCQGVLFNLEPPIKGWPNPRKIWWSDGFGSCESTKGLVMFGGWFWKLIIFLSKNKLSWRYLPRLHVRFFRLCSQAHLLEQGHPYRGCLKWWYPQLSSFFRRIFHYQPSSYWGTSTPIYGNPHWNRCPGSSCSQEMPL